MDRRARMRDREGAIPTGIVAGVIRAQAIGIDVTLDYFIQIHSD